jgi:ribonuclease D
MSEQPIWVDTDEALERELERVGSDGFGLDTEADSMHHFHEKICLIQLSAGGVDRLIDPLASIDLTPLGRMLADRGRRKILHGADYDLRMLHRDFSFQLHGLYDTMVAARLTGERALGLAALLEKYLRVRLDKRFQRADWSQRPLPPAMLDYAASDTRWLEDLAGLLESRLTRLGRSAWAAEEFRRLEAVRPRAKSSPEEAYARVKGAVRLDRRGLGVLRELVLLRDAIAAERDLPRFRILRDDLLLAIATRAPREALDLSRLPGLPRPWQKGGRNGELREAIDRALSLPEERLPPVMQRGRPDRDPALDARVRRLKRERDRVAERLDLDPSVLAPRATLEEVARCLASGTDPAEVEELRRWQLELLGPIFERQA